jgi:hypothetical protein
MSQPYDLKWVVLAVVIAPLAIVPAWLLFGLMDHLFGPVPWVHLEYHYHSVELVFGLLIGYLLTILVGLPAFLILRRYQLHTLPIIVGVSLVTVLAFWVLVTQSSDNLLTPWHISVTTHFGSQSQRGSSRCGCQESALTLRSTRTTVRPQRAG